MIELPAAVQWDLTAYADALGRGAVEPAKLIGPMLARLLVAERVFAKLRRDDLTAARSRHEKP